VAKVPEKNGRFDFQIDLGIQLIDMGIRNDWTNISDATNKPKWMQQKQCIPCNCKKNASSAAPTKPVL
jgi:hypothetical protein